jgi:hypothetical protein
MIKIGKIMVLVILATLLVLPLGSAFQKNATIDSNEQIIIDFTFTKPEFKYDEKFENYIISINGLSNSQVTNKASLPVKPLKILLPYAKTLSNVNIEVLQNPILYENINPQNGPRIVPISTDSYVSNEIKQVNNQETTNLLYSIIGIHYFRGFPILHLNINPLIYNQESQTLVFYPKLKITINTEEKTPSPVLRGLENDKKIVQSMVDNPDVINSYEQVSSIISNDATQYIIITSEEFKNSDIEDNFQYLMHTKNNRGITTDIFSVEEIIDNPDYSVNGTWGDNNPSNPFYQQAITENYGRFDDKAARIRNFIRYAFMQLGVEYVLLGGDGDIDNEEQNIIPARGLFANESGLPLINSQTMDEEEDDIPSDVYYACLDGNYNYDMDMHFGESPDRNNIDEIEEADLMAEVYVGRACIDSDYELAIFVMKTISYDNSDNSPYLKKILFIGEYLAFPGISAWGGNYKDLVKPFIPDDYNLETLYDRDLPQHWNKYDLIEIINSATPHMINHDGHANYGYSLKMSISDVDMFTNDDYFFLYSHGCNAGGFDNIVGYDCIAEEFTVGSPHGPFACILNSRYGLGSENNLNSPSNALDISFHKALFNESIRQIGRASHYSKEDHIWHINDNGIRWVFYQTNLFGDPEISIKDPMTTSNEIFVNITRPENSGILYFMNYRFLPLFFKDNPVIIGAFRVEVDAYTIPDGYVYGVEFLIDDQTKHMDTEAPYEWMIDEPMKGTYELSVIAHESYGEKATDSMSITIWIRG